MSLKEYLDKKSKPATILCVKKYKENLIANLSSLMLKPIQENINEAFKQSINYVELKTLLSEIQYPSSEVLQICLKSGNVKKINLAQNNFSEWASQTKANKQIVLQIENLLFDFQANMYKSDLSAEDVDRIVESCMLESVNILERICNFVENTISKVKSWKNHAVKIEAITPEDDFIIKEAKVSVGDVLVTSFNVEFVLESRFVVKNFNEQNIPSNLSGNLLELVSLMKKNVKNDNIHTLYMTTPLSERSIFNNIKKDLSLGIISPLPVSVTFSNQKEICEDSVDCWKVKIDSKYLREIFSEGNSKKYKIIDDHCPVRWLERVS